MPTVSVIMPAYNAARYLDLAAASVLRQTISDLELIVVDDGSTDDTVERAHRWAALDPRVKVISQAHAGPGPARNRAFSVATGRYFAFLDSDDEWDATFLEAQLSVIESRPDVDVVIGNARLHGGPRHGQPARPVRGGGQPITLAEILADDLSLFIMAVFRRDVIGELGGFDPEMFTNEEYELWIRGAIAGVSFTRNPSPLGWYRCRGDSLSADPARMLKGILRVLTKTQSALRDGSPERAILDRQLARFRGDLAALRARASLARGDYRMAAQHMATLHRIRGGWLLGLAARAPRVASACYRLRQRLMSARTAPQRTG